MHTWNHGRLVTIYSANVASNSSFPKINFQLPLINGCYTAALCFISFTHFWAVPYSFFTNSVDRSAEWQWRHWGGADRPGWHHESLIFLRLNLQRILEKRSLGKWRGGVRRWLKRQSRHRFWGRWLKKGRHFLTGKIGRRHHQP